MEVSAKNAWGKKNCLTPAFLAHTGFFFKISNYQCPLDMRYDPKKKKKPGGKKFLVVKKRGYGVHFWAFLSIASSDSVRLQKVMGSFWKNGQNFIDLIFFKI